MKRMFFTVVLISCLAMIVQAQYSNVTEQALGYTPATVPGMESVGWLDVNNDGWPDMFVCSKYLYLNNQDGTFTLQSPDSTGFNGMGGVYFSRATFADADNDGDLDCIQTPYYSSDRTMYFENSGAPDFHFDSTTIFVHDYAVLGGQPTFFNSDSDLDYEAYLGMLGNWSPTVIGRDRFFDQAGGSWFDATATNIPQLMLTTYRRPVRGNVACDYDNDGDMDVFVPVYGITTGESHLNMLWQNDGAGNFVDVAQAAGVAIQTGSNYNGLASGASWGDIDNDGWFDLAVANIHGLAPVYRNNHDGTFTEEIASIGLPTYQREWHNTLFLDFDNDGDMDLFLNQWYNGYRAYLFRNDGPENLGHFTEVTNNLGFTSTTDLNYITGWATADYDRDGDLDLLYYNASDSYKGTYLWRNDSAATGNHWLVARLQGNGITVNQHALGAKAQILFSDSSWSPVMQVEASSADQGQNMTAIHFGLGQHTSFTYIKVNWPDGNEEYFFQEALSQPFDAWVDVLQGTGSLTNLANNNIDPQITLTTVQNEMRISSKMPITQVTVFNVLGNKLLSKTCSGENSVAFNTGDLHGFILIEIQTETGRLVKKLFLL